MMWLQGHAIYAAHFIVVIFSGSMLANALLRGMHQEFLLQWLPFTSAQVLKGEVWRILTYGLVNQPSLMFVVNMFMLAWFGRELEKFFGRRQFLVFYGSLYLFTPLLFTLIGLWVPMNLAGSVGAFGVFIAFATLYPGAVMMFNILAKWLALLLVGIYTLISLSDRDWVGMFTLWATTGFAFIYIRYQQGHFALPNWRIPRGNTALRALPDLPVEKPVAFRGSKDASMVEIDALLDKIARSGISSLTAKERARLDEARMNLLTKKNSSGR
jgi:membrane associated rhomboid family serine protease